MSLLIPAKYTDSHQKKQGEHIKGYADGHFHFPCYSNCILFRSLGNMLRRGGKLGNLYLIFRT